MNSNQTKPKPIEKADPPFHNTGPGSYNRESGNKTLIFVSILIIMIIALVVIILFTIHRRTSVMIQGESIQLQKQTSQ